MAAENRNYDASAQALYNLHRNERTKHSGWPNFHHLKRKERDWWRGLAQIAIEEDTWPGLGK